MTEAEKDQKIREAAEKMAMAARMSISDVEGMIRHVMRLISPQKIPCLRCMGNGFIGHHLEPCPVCGGKGTHDDHRH